MDDAGLHSHPHDPAPTRVRLRGPGIHYSLFGEPSAQHYGGQRGAGAQELLRGSALSTSVSRSWSA